MQLSVNKMYYNRTSIRLIMIRAVLFFCGLFVAVQSDADLMKEVTKGFGKAFQDCSSKHGLSEAVMDDFFHFWRDDFKFENRELGCVIQCMSQSFELLTESQRMHHGNTHDFIKSFPNGEKLAQQMVGIIHMCEKKFENEDDHCWRILRIAECFKVTAKKDGIAPTIEMVLAELIMEADA